MRLAYPSLQRYAGLPDLCNKAGAVPFRGNFAF